MSIPNNILCNIIKVTFFYLDFKDVIFLRNNYNLKTTNIEKLK